MKRGRREERGRGLGGEGSTCLEIWDIREKRQDVHAVAKTCDRAGL